MNLDFVTRTAIWIGVIALWALLSRLHEVGMLPAWAGGSSVFGGTLILAGVGLYTAAAVSLARAKRDSVGTPEVLLTSGPYRYVRNPVYLAIGIIMVGLLLLYQAWRVSVVVKTAFLFVGTHLAVVFLEEPTTRMAVSPAFQCERFEVTFSHMASNPMIGSHSRLRFGECPKPRFKGTLFFLGGLCWLFIALGCAWFLVQYLGAGAGIESYWLAVTSGSVFLGMVQVTGLLLATGLSLAIGIVFCAYGWVRLRETPGSEALELSS